MLNKSSREKGFTLVELLAVIVILAIILVIAVPQIMDTIESSRIAAMESSVKMVAAQVENQYTVAKTLGKEFLDTGSCMEEWAGLNDADYKTCTYKMGADGTALVTISGQGKFSGYTCKEGSRNSAKCGKGPVRKPGTGGSVSRPSIPGVQIPAP